MWNIKKIYTMGDIHRILGKYVINIYYFNTNLIRRAKSHEVDRHGSPDQTRRACQRDAIQHFWWSYCFSDRFMIYHATVIQTLWNKYLGSTVQGLLTKGKHILERTIVKFFFAYFEARARSWVEKHSKYIGEMHFCYRICKLYFETDKVYLVQILCGAIWMTSK